MRPKLQTEDAKLKVPIPDPVEEVDEKAREKAFHAPLVGGGDHRYLSPGRIQ
jgi:hypothetical protein